MTTPAVRQVSPAKLAPDPNQPRKAFPETSLRELADSIKARGMLQPILVTEGAKKQMIILDGERRWRAAKTLKLKTVPVLVSKDAGDTTQRGIDQIAANSVRADLSIMDMAHWLKAQQTDRRTPNDIAAAMAKAGMKALDQKRIAQLVKLPDLPKFARDMIDAEELLPEDALQLEVLARAPKTIEFVAKILPKRAAFSGQVRAADVLSAISQAFDSVAVDLRVVDHWAVSPGHPLVHFDYKLRCKGCEHLVQRSGGAWCLNRKQFEEHNAEAKEAGLLPGGKKPVAERKPTAATETRQTEEKAEQRTESLKRRIADYLRAWLIDAVLERLPTRTDVQTSLLHFAALGWPAAYTNHGMMAAAGTLRLENLGEFLHPAYLAGPPKEVLPTVAAHVVQQLDVHHVVNVAHVLLGATLDGLWTIDQKFLDLLRKSELAGIAKQHAALPDGKRSWDGLKTDELCAAILAVAEKIQVAPQIAEIYADAIHGSELDDDEPELDPDADGDLEGDDD